MLRLEPFLRNHYLHSTGIATESLTAHQPSPPPPHTQQRLSNPPMFSPPILHRQCPVITLPPAAPTPIQVPDLAMLLQQMHASQVEMMDRMQQQQLQMQQNMLQFTQSVAAKPSNKPAQYFPFWDGGDATKSLFIERLITYQQDPYFSGADWSSTIPGLEEKSTFLRATLPNSLSSKWATLFHSQT